MRFIQRGVPSVNTERLSYVVCEERLKLPYIMTERFLEYAWRHSFLTVRGYVCRLLMAFFRLSSSKDGQVR